MVSLLCMSDRTHSQLMELLPEKCGAPQNKDFDAILAQARECSLLSFFIVFRNVHYLNILCRLLTIRHPILKRVDPCNKECTCLKLLYGKNCMILFMYCSEPFTEEIFRHQWIGLLSSKSSSLLSGAKWLITH